MHHPFPHHQGDQLGLDYNPEWNDCDSITIMRNQRMFLINK